MSLLVPTRNVDGLISGSLPPLPSRHALSTLRVLDGARGALDGFNHGLALVDAVLLACFITPAFVEICVPFDGLDFEPVAWLVGFAVAMGGLAIGIASSGRRSWAARHAVTVASRA